MSEDDARLLFKLVVHMVAAPFRLAGFVFANMRNEVADIKQYAPSVAYAGGLLLVVPVAMFVILSTCLILSGPKGPYGQPPAPYDEPRPRRWGLGARAHLCMCILLISSPPLSGV